jgi:hypothetical protein
MVIVRSVAFTRDKIYKIFLGYQPGHLVKTSYVSGTMSVPLITLQFDVDITALPDDGHRDGP